MSFVGTPLGQGRRLDHSSFLGKPPSTGSQPAYTAPALGSRSPPKTPAPAQETDENDSALSRFARAKQQATQDFSDRPGGPKIITSPPKPERWSVKDTSVNIATAFTQAAATMSTTSTSYTHNNAWASTSRATMPVPRSTSVEYEAAAPQAANRRLPGPPDKFNRPATTATRKPLSKTPSFRHVPDSEGEEDRSATTNIVRGKSPFEHGLSFARTALTNAAYYVRQRSREPEDQSLEHPHPSVNGSANGNESSYDYAEEEQAFQAQKRNAALKRNRMSKDNKAYKPSQESEDESEWSDDGKTRRRRRKFKKGPAGGPLSSLPVVTADKRRRKKSRGNLLDADEDDSGSDGNRQVDTSVHSTISLQNSHAPPSRPTHDLSQNDFDDSMLSAEQGLQSIPEVEEELLLNDVSGTKQLEEQRQSATQRRAASTRPRSRSRSRTPGPHTPISRFSIGGLLGSLVHLAAQLGIWTFSGFLSIISMITFGFGQVFGTTFDLIWRRPAWARGAGSLRKYLIPAVVLVCAWYGLRSASLGTYVPSLTFPTSSPPRYNVPPADIAELAERLLRIENAISGPSRDTKTEDSTKDLYELQSRLASLEGKIVSETRKAQDLEAKARDVFSTSISGVKREVEMLQSQLTAQRKQMEKDRGVKAGPGPRVSDDEARMKLKALEERLGGVEGGVKDALEQLAKRAQAPSAPSPATGPAWWNKLAGAIKSADGQDITLLISQLVDSAVSTLSKDTIAKPDFALFSGGARVIPSLTSATLEIRPKGFTKQLRHLFSNAGYAVGRAPVTALHHELHPGQCWPFAGKEGQLGVKLAVPTVLVEEVTIDHVAKDVAYDLRTAPREMEVWGLVGGKANIERVRAWRESGAAASYDSRVVYPPTLSKHPEFILLANFTYDIHAPNHIQTFAVDPEIRALNMDFGIVVLRVLSNWGMDALTCLYRFRVHGENVGGVPAPMADEILSSREGVDSGTNEKKQGAS